MSGDVRISSYCVRDGKIFGSTFEWDRGVTEYEATDLLDADGDETIDPEEAVVAIFNVGEKWVVADLRKFVSIVGS